MDFVTRLPTDHRFNTVLVVSCCMSKERHLIPCTVSEKRTLAEATAELIIQNVVKLHRLPDTVVLDCRP